jgi:hypothetical protein
MPVPLGGCRRFRVRLRSRLGVIESESDSRPPGPEVTSARASGCPKLHLPGCQCPFTGNGFLDTLVRFDSAVSNRRPTHCAMAGAVATSSRALLLVATVTCQPQARSLWRAVPLGCCVPSMYLYSTRRVGTSLSLRFTQWQARARRFLGPRGPPARPGGPGPGPGVQLGSSSEASLRLGAFNVALMVLDSAAAAGGRERGAWPCLNFTASAENARNLKGASLPPDSDSCPSSDSGCAGLIALGCFPPEPQATTFTGLYATVWHYPA